MFISKQNILKICKNCILTLDNIFPILESQAYVPVMHSSYLILHTYLGAIIKTTIKIAQ